MSVLNASSQTDVHFSLKGFLKSTLEGHFELLHEEADFLFGGRYPAVKSLRGFPILE